LTRVLWKRAVPAEERLNFMIPKGLAKVKTALYVKTDVEGRRHRSRTGLDTLVVFAVNYECHKLDMNETRILTYFSGNSNI
jgi:hypothetical protein